MLKNIRRFLNRTNPALGYWDFTTLYTQLKNYRIIRQLPTDHIIQKSVLEKMRDALNK
jgi:hypothetical protein